MRSQGDIAFEKFSKLALKMAGFLRYNIDESKLYMLLPTSCYAIEISI